MSDSCGSLRYRLASIVGFAGLVSILFFWFYQPLINCPPQLPSITLHSDGHHIRMNNSSKGKQDKPILLLWVWPENYRFDLNICKTIYNIDGCHLTDDRSLYSNTDAVLLFHKAIRLSTLPPSPRPPFQKWIWMNVESPTNTKKIPGIENLFNLTLSYREDSDIPVRLRLTSRKIPDEDFEIPKKERLICWVVSNNAAYTGVGTRNTYYRELSKYVHIHVYGKAYGSFLDYKDYFPTIASCKFYLSFENSIHKDYITEKLNGPLAVGTVPVVLGPPRKNYERFVPGDSFIHVDDFPDAKSLVEYLVRLDVDDDAYRRYFNWRRHFSARPHLILQNQEFVLAICTACDYVGKHQEYKQAHDIYEWFFN
ncbi:4-galactosyl-N-acetylglucosaminide 3-alpha-L-fucosyltransferase 9-like [Misgurnus anguillicaudatus]|uniref:4-galactosyl-N-acetylglucosaminide 3-alpha-L-fucosyltransferase 9-like n=1 Tax=Misgurnus anguillicaudatus TaxID=75329 RepID=UPI002435A523|nr:4-galactosyl-N-acetylglucosaminide 3-alpha-L-fucosyltransferase 9-like [Misgurnus anguillicaudatus]